MYRVTGLPKRDLIDGLFGLLFFFFNSAANGKASKSIIRLFPIVKVQKKQISNNVLSFYGL